MEAVLSSALAGMILYLSANECGGTRVFIDE